MQFWHVLNIRKRQMRLENGLFSALAQLHGDIANLDSSG
jgi:hypothetical protein